jgi:membrane-associated phospholipid phosphatase
MSARPVLLDASAPVVAVGGRTGRLGSSGRAQALLFVAAFALYRLAHGLTAGSGDRAREHGESILSAEQALRLAIEPGVQRALHPVVGISTAVYLCAQLVVIWIVLAWCWRRSRPVYRRLRASVVGSWVFGIACFAAWPAAPPRFVHGAGVSNTLANAFGSADERSTAIFNPYAAMPSLHCAFALLAGIAIWQAARGPWRLLGVLWPAAVAIATVATGNHWVLDIVAGFVLAAAAWAAGSLAQWPRASSS